MTGSSQVVFSSFDTERPGNPLSSGQTRTDYWLWLNLSGNNIQETIGLVSIENPWQPEGVGLHISSYPSPQWNKVLETQGISCNTPIRGETILIMAMRKNKQERRRKKKRNHSWYLFNIFHLPVSIQWYPHFMDEKTGSVSLCDLRGQV